MKTAISLPDDIFDATTRRAAELGISRSQFFAAAAARRYLAELDNTSMTSQIDEVLGLVKAANQTVQDDSASAAVEHGRSRLAGDAW